MQIRRKLRLAISRVLSDPTIGINSRIANLSPDYGVDAFEFDFGENSRNIFYGFLPQQTDLSSIADYPALVIYTTDALNTHDDKPLTFSGSVIAHVNVWLRFQEGAEQYDTESVCELVEDAMVTCFEDDAADWPSGVSFTGRYQGFWQPITQIEDGWERILPMEFLFQINA